jgi:L-asparaginase/Glu-tRNA(Gln) amidotransferase subunit D
MTEPAGDRAITLSQRVLRAQVLLEEAMQHLADSVARLQATRQEVQAGRSQRAVLHDNAYARLEARLATLPVIEQAKGIVMAQTGCGPEDAFDLLRKASQRGNIPVRELAVAVVARAGDSGPGLSGDPGRRD